MSDTKKPVVQFTIQEAIEHYKDDPTVMCLADEQVLQMDSRTIHGMQEQGYDEPWLWAYEKKGSGETVSNTILLYAPGKLSTTYYKAPIMDS